MELTIYQAIMILMGLIVQTTAAVAYISRIKNDLTTRVAVLEAGHTSMTNDLLEIKKDVKELLAWANKNHVVMRN